MTKASKVIIIEVSARASARATAKVTAVATRLGTGNNRQSSAYKIFTQHIRFSLACNTRSL